MSLNSFGYLQLLKSSFEMVKIARARILECNIKVYRYIKINMFLVYLYIYAISMAPRKVVLCDLFDIFKL